MDIKKIALFLTIVILILISGIYLSVRTNENTAHQLINFVYVGGSGPDNYTSIQQAIDQSKQNGTVYIYEGIYNESITLEKQLTLQGTSSLDTIIEGGFEGTCLIAKGNGIKIENIHFRKAGGQITNSLIYCGGNNLKIDRCIFGDSRHGLVLSKIKNVTIQNCTFYRTGIGIQSQQSTDISIMDSSFIKNGIGTLSTKSRNLKIKRILGELNGITVMTENSEDIIIAHSTLFNGNENQVSIYAERTTDTCIENCTIYHSGRGIRLSDCGQTLIQKSQIFDSKIGIETSSNSQLQIEKSWIYDNDVGIYLHESKDTSLRDNAIFDNAVANLAAEDSSVTARHNWWKESLNKPIKIYLKNGKTSIIPTLKEQPSKPSTISFYGHRFLPPQTELSNHHYDTKNDSDEDSIPNWWENTYGYNPTQKEKHYELDPDQDGLNNIEEFLTSKWGSHPYKKDLFIEIDIMDSSYSLDPKKLDTLKQRFANHDISLHIDTGMMGGGEITEKKEYVSYTTLIDLYWTYFLNNDPMWWRKGIFHYVLLSDSLLKSAPGFVFIGWDNADAFALSMEYYQEEIPPLFRPHVVSTVFMHELGHTLGLFHDVYPAIDNESSIIPFIIPLGRGQWTYRNYRSCMNYQYAWQVLDYSDGTHGRNDFDDWSHINLRFFQDSHWGT
jgi:parallel beta-helix repeat protein